MHTYYEMKLWSDYERTRLCETIMSGINVQLMSLSLSQCRNRTQTERTNKYVHEFSRRKKGRTNKYTHTRAAFIHSKMAFLLRLSTFENPEEPTLHSQLYLFNLTLVIST